MNPWTTKRKNPSSTLYSAILLSSAFCVALRTEELVAKLTVIAGTGIRQESMRMYEILQTAGRKEAVQKYNKSSYRQSA